MRALFMAVSALGLAVLASGCSHEHGPLSDTPDTTSLAVAGGLGPGGVSTAYGIYPESPGLLGVDDSLANRSTSTAVRPAPLVPGTPNNPDAPRTSNAVQDWTSGPNLPVEQANRALEPEGAEAPVAHGNPPG
ncbi:MAG: hypothetical protein ACLQDQ_17735 [Myxococcaceae bacterium]